MPGAGLAEDSLLEEVAWSRQHPPVGFLPLVRSQSLLTLLEKSRPVLSLGPFRKHQAL